MSKKYLEPTIPLICWAAWTWFCYQGSLGFPIRKVCEESEHTGYEQCSTYYSLFMPIVEVGTFIEDHDGAIVGLFTVALAISTILLWKATARLADGADQSLRMMMNKERAYLTPDRPICNFPITKETTTIEEFRGLIPVASHQWANIGGSAARIHKMRLEITIAPSLPERPDWSKSGASVHYGHYVIGKDYTDEGFERKWEAPITDEMATDFIANRAIFFVYGAVVYTDVFDKKWTYVFAMKWKPSEGKLVSTIGAAYNRRYEGNYPDDYPE